MTVDELLAKHGIKLASTAPGRYYTTCPHCSAGRASKEHRAAKVLGVTIEADGSVRWGCNHCVWTGPEKGDAAKDGNGRGGEGFAATYDYTDAAGALLFQKVRNAPGRDPRFWLRRPDGKGGWINGTKGINTGILYRAPGVARAIAEGRVVAVVEGEKDVNSLRALGIIATCNAHGASELGKRPKWARAHSEQLRGADIVVLNDNDGAGYAHADATCKLSVGVAKRVRRLDLAKHWPQIPTGGDVSDWLALGHTGEELAALIEQAPDYEPPPGAKEKAPPPDSNGIDDAAEIEKLARLAPLDYERARKDAGKRLGISRLALLDALVKAKRGELGLDGGNSGQGRPIEFPEVEPWPQPVNGRALLDEVANAIRHHVVLTDTARDSAALWIAHTYLLDRVMITPRLAITSPVKGCGKTTLLDVIGQLAHRSLPAANCSASAVFRVVEGHRPCLLIDEADSFLSDNEELRGVLNAGHRRGGSVLRNVGDDHEPRAFATYAACAIALIGQLPGTLADRSVPVRLVRRKADEVVTPFRLDRVDHLVELARKLMRWTNDNAEAIAASEPQMPAGLYNRAADNWRGLCAIAKVAGDEWLARAHGAALEGAGANVDEMSRLELLLGDIRDVFDGLVSDADRISSAHLIEKLCQIVPRPWGEYGRSGKPLTQNKLAALLKPLAIKPQVLRIGTETPSGYFRHQFKEAWERLLSSKGEFKPQHLNKRDEMGTSDLFQTSTVKNDVEVRKSQKSNNDGLCLGVEVAKGDPGRL
jgi:hypothetical protein